MTTASAVSAGYMNSPPSVHSGAPSLIRHVPLTAKHPAVRFTPLANEDEAVDSTSRSYEIQYGLKGSSCGDVSS